MPKLNTLKSLGSLFRSSINSTPATTTSAAAAAAKISPAVDRSLEHFVSSLYASSACWVSFKRPLVNSQVNHVNRLVDSCAVRLGTAATLNVCRKLGGETVVKEFNALLKICIETASTTDDWTVAMEQVSTALEVFISMKEQGFPIEEESYGPVLLYLIDKGMVGFFYRFTRVIRYGSASTLARLGYYESLLYIRVNAVEKYEEFINQNRILTSDGDETDYYSPHLF